jgi:SRSO17 transposase
MPQVAGNCWPIAEAAGLDRPCRLHHLLDRACWDEDAARDAVRAFLTRHLGADGGVLIFDETGQAKKGTATAAAGRQYSGTMGSSAEGGRRGPVRSPHAASWLKLRI